MTEQNFTMTQEESGQTSVRIKAFGVNLTHTKVELHELACNALKHYHNYGQVALIQELYDVLSTDKLMRHASFAKWAMAYSPLVFNEKTKKFSKNKNPNSGKVLYMEDESEGINLMSTAFSIRFWDISGGEEAVNVTTWDKFAKNMETMLKQALKEKDSGNLTVEEAKIMASLESTFIAIQDTVAPLTTKALEESVAEIEESKVA